MQDIKVTVTHPITSVISELQIGNQSLVFEKSREGEGVTYKHVLTEGLDFLPSGYDYLYSLDNDASTKCLKTAITITEGGDTIFEGYISSNNTRRWPKMRQTSKQLTEDSNYTCLDENIKKKTNVLTGTTAIPVKTFSGELEKITVQVFSEQNLDLGSPAFDMVANAPTTGLPGNLADWALISVRYYNIDLDPFNPGFYVANIDAVWGRTGTNPNYEPPPTVLVEEDREFDLSANPQDREINTTFEVVGGDTGTYPGGRTLQAVLEKLLEDCGYNLVSNFFSINPDGTAPITNTAYAYALQYFQDIIITQKSNVLRNTASNVASKLEFTLSDFLDDLKLLNVYHIVDDNNNFRLEHISYFRNTGTILDLTGRDEIDGLDEQETSDAEHYLYEGFAMMEETSFAFECEITNSAGCSNNDRTDRAFKLTNNDLHYMTQNESRVSDFGMVWFCTEEVNGEQKVIKKDVLGTEYLNGALSFRHIVTNLWLHDRPEPTFQVNGTTVTSLSIRANKTYNPIEVSGFTKSEWLNFSPQEGTVLIDGEDYQIDSATWSPRDNKLILQLSF